MTIKIIQTPSQIVRTTSQLCFDYCIASVVSVDGDFMTFVWFVFHKAGYALIVLAFRHVRALFREFFCEIANQSLYTSHNVTDFVHLWFCEKFFRIVFLDSLWKYRSPGENGETRDEKNDWRGSLRNAIYTVLIFLVSPTFFHVLVNLTISV